MNVGSPPSVEMRRSSAYSATWRGLVRACFSSHIVPEATVLMEECVFNLEFSLLNLPPLPSSRAPSTASLPHSSPSPSASPRLFSVTRGLAGDKPMSAEDVGRVGGTEEKGRWRGEEGEWKAVSNADLFWADKRRTLCAEATGFNLGAATFGINYHTYSSTATAYCVHGYYIHSNTNFMQLLCWNLVLHRSFLLLLWCICIIYSCTEMLVHKEERGQQDIFFFFCKGKCRSFSNVATSWE